jgi:hypothetical protein
MLVNFNSSCSSGGIYPDRLGRHCSFFFSMTATPIPMRRDAVLSFAAAAF